MDKELTLVLRTLKQKTGISVDVYSADFKFLYSGGERIQFTYDGGYTEGLQDKKQNVTLFRFRFKRENYYGVISGSNDVARNYAMFICEHMESNGTSGDELSKRDFLRGIVFGECSGMQSSSSCASSPCLRWAVMCLPFRANPAAWTKP